MNKQSISETKVDLMYKLYDEGNTINKIARIINVSRNTVHKYLEQGGMLEVDKEAVKRGAKRLSDKEIATIKDLYNAGVKINDIVEEVGVSTATVYRHVNRKGMPKKSYTREQLDDAVDYYNSNDDSITEVAESHGVPRSTLYWAITKRREGRE